MSLAVLSPIATAAAGCFAAPSVAACITVGNDPAAQSFVTALSFVLFVFTAARTTGNDSWVDRLWSVTPVLYAWQQVALSEGAPTRLTARALFALCVSLWGARMTFNFYRRGGYEKGGEDYRWGVIRTWPVFRSKAMWVLFSFGFISTFQMLLLWAQTVPLLTLPVNAAPDAVHYVQAAAFLTMLTVETVADQQQWVFQQSKHLPAQYPRLPHLAADYERGFLTHGLFALSRHPNVYAEQTMWAIIYSVTFRTYGLVNWTGIGALVLVLLTIRSTFFTESITAAKYPAYKEYQALVPMLAPALRTSVRKLDHRK
jgi:steroid 5-alpha reductase family enzyme